MPCLITRLDNLSIYWQEDTRRPFSYRQPETWTGLKTLNPSTGVCGRGLPLRGAG
nr:P2 family phage major capsid protein [Escherichia coli]